MQHETKKTPLHGWHTANGANMADFGGYEMPLWYSSTKKEHLAVLTAAGLFDTSHMASILMEGKGAFTLLQNCFTNDLNACIGPHAKPLSPGRCVYGAFLTANGATLDDAIVFMIAQHRYMVVVNAGMGADVTAHLGKHAKGLSVVITDLTDNLGKIDIQGPAAARIMAKILADPQNVFTDMPYFSFKGFFDPDITPVHGVTLTDGTPLLLSRTGYTGEFGFEIFIKPDRITTLWEMILEVGQKYALLPCGLAARDSLRAGAVLPLSHQDIGPWPFIAHPWSFALPYNAQKDAFTKEFIGSKALMGITEPQYTHAFVGGDLRKVSVLDPALVIDDDGAILGKVLTCATDMGIGTFGGRIYSIASPDKPEGFKAKGLCCGFMLSKQKLAIGRKVTLKDKRRTIRVTIADDIRPDRTARKPLNQML
jgi:aminomethyltransferase